MSISYVMIGVVFRDFLLINKRLGVYVLVTCNNIGNITEGAIARL